MRCVAAVTLGLALATTTLGADKPTATERISFRTVKPIVGHYPNEQAADQVEKTLKQIGCSTKRAAHQGHIDLTYACPHWSTLTLRDAKEVAEWQKWLSGKGFAVVHNTPGKDHPEAVQYHLPTWKTLHFHQPQAAKSHVEMLKMLGCEVRTAKHNGHDDVRFRCAGWQSLGVASHKQAHAWMASLKRLGFATVHEHGSGSTANVARRPTPAGGPVAR